MTKLRLPEFLLIPSVIIEQKMPSLDGQVYGIVYWYSQLYLKKCVLSNESIAGLLGTTAGSVANSLSRLAKIGYVQVILDESNHRKEIVPTIIFRTPSSTNEPPFISKLTPPSSTNEHNNMSSNKRNKLSPDFFLQVLTLSEEELKTLPDEYRIYRYYLLKFKKTPARVKFTDTRRSHVLARLKSFPLEEIIQAVKNTSQSPFHLGQNERGWKADFDFIFRNDEQIEKLRDMTPKGGEKKILVTFPDGSSALATDQSGEYEE